MSKVAERPGSPDPHDWRALRLGIERFVRSRVHDPALADDLTQETLARLVRHRDRVRDDERLVGYALRIARHVVVDHHRARKSDGEESFEEGRLPGVSPDGAGEDADAARLRTVLAGWTAARIETLPDPYREILRRTELRGESQRAVADDLGLPHSTVKSRVQRGRDRLHADLLACCEVDLDVRGRVTDVRARPDGCGTTSCAPASSCGEVCGSGEAGRRGAGRYSAADS